MGSIARNKGQVYSVGNYLMTGKTLGKGHFARVEEATHRLIGKKVAIKVIDLTCIKEEYARRNLHREPRVMAKLRHPCIAALYETMMHGPRLYVVMEAAGGGDLCALVLRTRGLPEARARVLAAQLVSAVRHMHCRGVVHRDLKMENIMLDSTKQFIKIVDFGLSNVWSAGGALRTPCGSLEYAAPELFVDGRRYGPEVDLWSIGVIVFGMVTGGLPFAGGAGGGGAGGATGARGGGARGAGGAGEGSSRPQLRAAIARGFSGKQRLALACFSAECKTFVQHLLEPNVEARMGIEEAARHRWLRRPGLRLKSQPLPDLDAKANREIYREVSERCGRSPAEVAAHVRAEPFGALGGMYNIRCHCAQLQAAGAEPLWAGARDPSPPYCAAADSGRANTPVSSRQSCTPVRLRQNEVSEVTKPTLPKLIVPHKIDTPPIYQGYIAPHKTESKTVLSDKTRSPIIQSRPLSLHGLSKPVFKVYDNGDCVDPRLPSIDEHSNSPDPDKRRSKLVRRASLDEPLGCLARGEARPDCYRRAGNGLPRNIASPHSSSNSHCKSDRTMPIGWYTTRTMHREAHLQRMRRTASLTTK